MRDMEQMSIYRVQCAAYQGFIPAPHTMIRFRLQYSICQIHSVPYSLASLLHYKHIGSHFRIEYGLISLLNCVCLKHNGATLSIFHYAV